MKRLRLKNSKICTLTFSLIHLFALEGSNDATAKIEKKKKMI